jgi:nucleotide-binding universal stress UspA family protein
MFRRILVALDGSTFAEHALPYAAAAARRHRAELILMLVHVRQSPVTTELALRDAIDDWESSQTEREAVYLNDLADRMAREYALAVRVHLRHGEVVPCIDLAVRQEHVDLVVLTTHGRAGFERLWLGSVADQLLRHIETPVLVIRPADAHPPAVAAGDYRHVLVALDGSERAERAIEPALALAGDDSRLTFLRIVAPPAAITSPYLPHAARISQTEMERRTEEATRYVEDVVARPPAGSVQLHATVVVDYHPAHALLGWSREYGVDLIAVSTHGRGPVRRLLMGSVTDKIVRASTVPVLVC